MTYVESKVEATWRRTFVGSCRWFLDFLVQLIELIVETFSKDVRTKVDEDERNNNNYR